MTTSAKSAGAGVLTRKNGQGNKSASFAFGLHRVKSADAMRLALELPTYRQPALHYPVYSLRHQLTDDSLMAVLRPRGSMQPIFIAAPDADVAKAGMAITHTARPYARELAKALRDELKIEAAEILTTRETAEGLAKEWPRAGAGRAQVAAGKWSWYNIHKPKPKEPQLPEWLSVEQPEQKALSGPTRQFAELTEGDKRPAALAMARLPGQNRVLFGATDDAGMKGDEKLVAALFNDLLAMAQWDEQRVDVILPGDRPALNRSMLGSSAYRCDAVYRRIRLSAGG